MNGTTGTSLLKGDSNFDHEQRQTSFSFSKEHRLRAVRHLPDILALLRILNDRFHRRTNRDEADKFKIREFFKELPKGKIGNYVQD